MGGASKLIMLLSSPFPRPSALRRLAGHPRPSVSFNGVWSISRRRYSSSSSSSFCSRSRFGLSITASEQLHSPGPGATTRQDFSIDPSSSGSIPNFRFPRQWPEWAKLEDNLRSCGYYDRSSGLELNGEDGISAFEELPEDFVRTVKACVLFARDRPELLGLVCRKDIEIVVENASPFLFRSAVDSVRRMKAFLRASGSNEFEFEKAHTIDLMRFLLSCVWSSSDVESLSSREVVESSVQNLLSELADASRSVQGSNLFGSLQQQFPDRFGNTVRPPPYRQNIEMKRGDWICSKCNFMNFARNMKCLECNEARPNRQLTGGEWECPQCDFFNHGRNVVCLRCDCKRPGETSFQPASPRYGVGYSNENASYQGVMGSGTLNSTNLSTISDSVNQSLDRIHSRSSPVSETGNSSNMDGGKNNGTEENSISRFASTLNRQSDGKNSNYVPFVPLPADMFAKPQKSKIEEEQVTYENNAIPSKVETLMNPNSAKSSDSTLPAEKPVYPTESKEDKEQAEKSERWFKKVAELHDVPDLASAISDEDFPEIMPMRKGENRFVVSKKKDRSLTSPQYRRRMAMEQSSSTNYVPFVPFPPDYFAKKDKQPETEASTGKNNEVVTADTGSRTSDSGVVGKGEQFSENLNISKESANTSFLPKSLDENKVDHASGGQHANPSYRSYEPTGGNRENWRDRSNEASPRSGSSPQSGNSGNSRESWKGKSLEGSLVKEPDPFDMSEEAKAERWFRRAAQIKDISELSQIPDEDFPQIMPMRKGVNRFVVSKRKTPLERRLTSPQYRRNLPIVSSEPLKKENNER